MIRLSPVSRSPDTILAIETSNPTCPSGVFGVALGPRGADGPVEVEPLAPRSRHDDALMPAIDRICRRHAIEPGKIGTVAVSIGPGGYTSLRIAATTAKVICEACGAACIPVPTGRALRVGVGATGGRPVAICLAWKREDVWCETFAGDDPSEQHRAASLVPLERLRDLNGHLIVAEAKLESRLRERSIWPDDARRIDPPFSPAHVVAASRLCAPIDPLTLAPLYPREPEAVSQWRRSRAG